MTNCLKCFQTLKTFIYLLLEHYSKCKSRQQNETQCSTNGGQSTITGYLTGTKRKECTEPTQENKNKKTKHQTSHSEYADPIDSDLDNSD